jgi:hypothetical protein
MGQTEWKKGRGYKMKITSHKEGENNEWTDLETIVRDAEFARGDNGASSPGKFGEDKGITGIFSFEWRYGHGEEVIAWKVFVFTNEVIIHKPISSVFSRF